VREQSAFPAIALVAREDRCRRKNHDFWRPLILMGHLCLLCGVSLPTVDRGENRPPSTSYDMSPVLLGQRAKCERKSWFYFTRTETSLQVRSGQQLTRRLHLRGDDGGTELEPGFGLQPRRKGGRELSRVSQCLTLWQDPQEPL